MTIARDGRPLADDDLLTPAEVAALAGCDPKTVTRWSDEGRLPVAVRTLGGHRRFRAGDVRKAMAARHATREARPEALNEVYRALITLDAAREVATDG